ncbi:MAG: DUF3644 domain-containing protein [Firmicutes bacterium]|nr:DUF3644 domain-containing protein [Bacillota bacterium]
MKTDKTLPIRKSYEFFLERHKTGIPFTLEEIQCATGWRRNTVRTYVTKKWDGFLTRNGGQYVVAQPLPYTEEEYVRLMSQKQALSRDPRKPDFPLETERLVAKAREAAVLALDIYNRPGTLFRTQGFIVMMVIAWTALFHAVFEKRGISYIYEKDGSPVVVDGDPKAWGIGDCMDRYFGSSNSPIRRNLDFIIGLRNKIEHRYVPAIDPHVGGECQALLMNFDDLLTSEFGDYYALRETMSVPLQTSTIRPQGQMEAMKRFQGKQYDEIKDYIDGFRAELPTEVYQDPRFSFRVYLVPRIGNHESSSDLAIEFLKYDPSNPEFLDVTRKIALIRDRRVEVLNRGKFRPSTVAQIVAKKIGRPFSIHNHTQAWKLFGVRKPGEDPAGCKTEYCQFDEPHSDYIYTQKWIDFLVLKLSDEQEYNRVVSFKW